MIVEKDTGNHHSSNHKIKKKLRICLDPRDLNEALEREPYHTCSVDEITAKFQGMTVFTIVDFKKGYWMVVLHPDSRKLTCMALPFGRFQWTWLPMGMKQTLLLAAQDSLLFSGSLTGHQCYVPNISFRYNKPVLALSKSVRK